jgi:NADH-quinone oxidoreductase subunit H
MLSIFISYEVFLGICLVPIILFTKSLGLLDIMNIQKSNSIPFSFFFLPLMLIYLIGMLAETNRAPFDLAEAEGDLVAGFNIEYGNINFLLIFLVEYILIILGLFYFNIIFNIFDDDLNYFYFFNYKCLI